MQQFFTVKRKRSETTVDDDEDGLLKEETESFTSNWSSCLTSSTSPVSTQLPLDSCGVSEISLFQRKDEAIADMCLFLCKTFTELISTSALYAFVSFVSKTGTRRVLFAVKQAGRQEELMNLLCSAKPKSDRMNLLLLRVGYHVAKECDLDVLLRRSSIGFFLSFCTAGRDCPHDDESQESSLGHPSRGLHWSAPRKKIGRAPQMSVAALVDAVDLLCGKLETASSSLPFHLCSCGLAVECLTQFLMRQNQTPSSGSESMQKILVECNALIYLCKLLKDHSIGEKHVLKVLLLLELITMSPDVHQYTEPLSQCVNVLADFLCPTGKDELTGHPEEELILRVLTNLTAIDPFPVDLCAARRFGRYCKDKLSSSRTMNADLLPYVLCTSINVAKRECKGKVERPFSSALLEAMTPSDFFNDYVQVLFHFYNSFSTEDIVLAGYYAILLCILSLVEYKEELRIPIITAVAKFRSEKWINQTAEHPMSIVVAIVQEFLLFQSHSSTLCSTAFVEVTEIVDRVLDANKISFSE